MARKATIILEAETGEARAEITKLQGGLREVEEATLEAGDATDRTLDRMEADYADLRQSAERTAQATRHVGGASSSASQLIFDMSDAAQDMSHSLSAGANNAGFLFEQFGRVKSQAGGTVPALKSMAGALAGPAGIAFAVTTALQHSDDLINFFTDSGEAAEKAAERYRSAADELLSIDTPAEEIELGLEAARRALNRFEGDVERIDERIEAAETLRGLIGQDGIPEARQAVEQQIGEEQATGEEERSVEEIRADAEERLGLENATREQVETRLEALREERQQLQAGANTLREQVGEAEALVELQERLAGLRRRQSIRQTVEGVQVDPIRGERAQAAPTQQAGRLEQQISNVQLVGQAAQSQFGAVRDAQEQTNNQISQGINLASQLGATMIQAAQGTEQEWNRVLGQLLGTIGSIIGLANPAAGATVAGAGTLIGSFKHGGTAPRSGMAKMHPPEIVAGVQGGAQIVGREETMQVLQGAAQSDQATRELQGLRKDVRALHGAMRSMEVRMSTSEADNSLSALEAEEERMGAREYDPTG